MTAPEKQHQKPSVTWLERSGKEEIIDPTQIIIDPHTHLFDRGYWSYLLPDMLSDLSSGHRVLGTVYIQNFQFYNLNYRTNREPIGETEFANGIAAMGASGRYGEVRPCAGIVSYIDLRLGNEVAKLIEAHEAVAGRRFKGVRSLVPYHDNPQVQVTTYSFEKDILLDPKFTDGLKVLKNYGHTLDIYLYFTQLEQLVHVLDRVEDASVVLNHIGGILGIGPFKGKANEVFSVWRSSMSEVAKRPNVLVKLGGLGMPAAGFGFERRQDPASSVEIAECWRPYFETCIELFGPERCMFETNFPMDSVGMTYTTILNAFKRICASYSQTEKDQLFCRTAMKTYKLENQLEPPMRG